MAHPRKRNEAEDRKRLGRTLKRSQLRKARKGAEKTRKEGRRNGGGSDERANDGNPGTTAGQGGAEIAPPSLS